MIEGEPRFYRYILANDDGWAPCVDDGLVTLATCKPKIRSVARPGDWVAGFVPGSQHRGLVAWIGRVAAKYDVGDYEKAYRGRRDAVYRATPMGIERLCPGYHDGPNEIRKDLSAPALVFDKRSTWYFGEQPEPLPEALIALAAKGQGHRVTLRLPGDLAALRSWLQTIGPPGIYRTPQGEMKAGNCGGCTPKKTAARAKPPQRNRC